MTRQYYPDGRRRKTNNEWDILYSNRALIDEPSSPPPSANIETPESPGETAAVTSVANVSTSPTELANTVPTVSTSTTQTHRVSRASSRYQTRDPRTPRSDPTQSPIEPSADACPSHTSAARPAGLNNAQARRSNPQSAASPTTTTTTTVMSNVNTPLATFECPDCGHTFQILSHPGNVLLFSPSQCSNTTIEGVTHPSTAHESTARESTVRESTARESAPRESTARRSTAHDSTARDSTARHSTAHDSTARHSTAHDAPARVSTTRESTTRNSAARVATSPTSASTPGADSANTESSSIASQVVDRGRLETQEPSPQPTTSEETSHQATPSRVISISRTSPSGFRTFSRRNLDRVLQAVSGDLPPTERTYQVRSAVEILAINHWYVPCLSKVAKWCSPSHHRFDAATMIYDIPGLTVEKIRDFRQINIRRYGPTWYAVTRGTQPGIFDRW